MPVANAEIRMLQSEWIVLTSMCFLTSSYAFSLNPHCPGHRCSVLQRPSSPTQLGLRAPLRPMAIPTNPFSSQQIFRTKLHHPLRSPAKLSPPSRSPRKPLQAESADDAVVGTNSTLIEQPTQAQLAAFALPTLAMRMCGPLMSLIDTAVVGTFGTVSQVASLTPGSVVCDSTSYLLTFLAIACTNLFSTAVTKNKPEEALDVIRSCMFLGLVSGVALAIGIIVFSPSFLQIFTAGSTMADVRASATLYAAIRAWGMPAAIVTMVAQAACFGDKDAATPLVSVIIAAVLNLALCLLFVHLWPSQPIAGVAWATSLAQWVGCVYMVLAMRTRFFLRGSTARESWKMLRVPPQRQIDDIRGFAGPAFLALFGKVICYASMSYAAAGAGTIALAAHQILMQVFFFFANIGDALSVTVQAFLPPLLTSGDKDGVVALVRNCIFLSLFLGVLDAFLAAAVPLFAWQLFTPSLAVFGEMKTQVLLLMGSLLFHSNVMALEGVLFASRDNNFLARAYAISTPIFTALMLLARKASVELLVVWLALFGYQVVRLTQFSFRALRNVDNFDATVALASGEKDFPKAA